MKPTISNPNYSNSTFQYSTANTQSTKQPKDVGAINEAGVVIAGNPDIVDHPIATGYTGGDIDIPMIRPDTSVRGHTSFEAILASLWEYSIESGRANAEIFAEIVIRMFDFFYDEMLTTADMKKKLAEFVRDQKDEAAAKQFDAAVARAIQSFVEAGKCLMEGAVAGYEYSQMRGKIDKNDKATLDSAKASLDEAEKEKNNNLNAIQNKLTTDPKGLAEDMTKRYEKSTKEQETNIQKQEQKVKTLEETVKSHEQELADNQKVQQENQEDIQKLNKNIKDKQEELNKVKKEKQSDNEIKKLTEELQTLQKQRADEVKVAEKTQEKINTLEKEVTDLERAKNDLNQMQHNLEDNLFAYETHKSECKEFEKRGWENLTEVEKARIQIREYKLFKAEENIKEDTKKFTASLVDAVDSQINQSQDGLIDQIDNGLAADPSRKTLTNAEYKSFNRYATSVETHQQKQADFYNTQRRLREAYVAKIQTFAQMLKSAIQMTESAVKGTFILEAAKYDQAAQQQENFARFIETAQSAITDIYEKNTNMSKDKFEQLLSEMRQRLSAIFELGNKLGSAFTSSATL